jgi:chromosome segregation protein
MQVNHWKTAVALAKQAILDSEKRKEELNESYLQINLRVSELHERVAQFGEKISSLEMERAAKRQEEEKLDKDSEEFDKMIIPAEGELNNLEQEQIGYQNIDLKSRHALSLVEHSYAQAKIELARQEETLESLRRRMEDDLGLVSFEYADQITGPTPLPFEGIVEKLPVTAELPEEVEETIKQKRAQLRRIGPVNPEAEKEFKELNERYTFLSDQVSDLEKAEADVRKVISELDELMERDLLHTFNLVSTEFKEVFSRLFNGGSARLLLTDPDDMTNTGIDIEARLPGRRMQGLSLLSGGERSLTATALIFSLLKVAPTPFCLLDEVDAMLDEANIVRFRELLQELSEHTQFVVVTHNRNTVQAADVIYGVTMGRDSTSHVVSLKPDEVVKEFAE